jgi:hypothetical protein
MIGHLRSDSLATTALARLHRALVRLPRRIDLPGPAQPHSRRSSTSFHAPGFLARTASGAVDVGRVVPGLAHRCLASLFDNQTGDSPAGACHGGSPRRSGFRRGTDSHHSLRHGFDPWPELVNKGLTPREVGHDASTAGPVAALAALADARLEVVLDLHVWRRRERDEARRVVAALGATSRLCRLRCPETVAWGRLDDATPIPVSASSSPETRSRS